MAWLPGWGAGELVSLVSAAVVSEKSVRTHVFGDLQFTDITCMISMCCATTVLARGLRLQHDGRDILDTAGRLEFDRLLPPVFAFLPEAFFE